MLPMIKFDGKRLRWILPTLVAPVLFVLVLLPARDWLTPSDVAMLQLLWVTFVAQKEGQRAAVICTLISVLLFDWFFVEPYYTLYIHQVDYLTTFAVMLLLGIFIARLSGRLRLQLARTHKHFRQRQHLLNSSRQARFTAELEHSRAMMLRSISHDLRTPLATIMGASSLLADRSLTLSAEDIHQQAGNIYQQSQLLNEHFTKVMELSRVQQMQGELAWQSATPGEVVSGAIARRAALLSQHPWLMQLPVRLSCSGDLTLLEIALSNMLENALRHGTEPIEIRYFQQQGQQVLQVVNAIQTKRKMASDAGTGLGIPICQAVMQLHRGQFTLQQPASGPQVIASLCWPLTNNKEQHG
ncbi:hypothetical protein GCM10010919_22680 [Alishewanella longhuensis]|uniref:histidine kinase n=1 Tax=Alishewanella longhuensis TaxID=1091037 RepID=A0ABQ3KYY6_9ALTE|nr:DUF4118 domain-containing protein [Alishewanella longhuensis]GHG71427.1 hypothetical protein GCM10010919_22680 [Alishewanella longhuensis]